MKLMTVLLVAAAGAGIFIANALDKDGPAVSISALEEGSVAAYCAQAVPEILQEHAKKPDANETRLERITGSAVFQQVGISFCQCTDDAYSALQIKGGDEAFGALAGLYLKLKFSNTLSREYRNQLKQEGQDIYRKNQALLRRKPEILEGTDEIFNACRKKQNVFGRS